MVSLSRSAMILSTLQSTIFFSSTLISSTFTSVVRDNFFLNWNSHREVKEQGNFEIKRKCFILFSYKWIKCKSGAGSFSRSHDFFLCTATHLAHRARHTPAPMLSTAKRTVMGFSFHFRFSNKTYRHLLVRTSMVCDLSRLSAFCVVSNSCSAYSFTPWLLTFQR